ncbi:MAG: EF-P beta-lysylation protein EpmB [Gammaproteobacteria bacterium]|nr:EF-P beta-lysylation protein EpmB [Gammaproteobacteria bacterium]
MQSHVKIIRKHTEPASTSTVSKPNWKKELANATTSASRLLKKLQLESQLPLIDERPDFSCVATDSYISKMQIGDINDPLLRQVLPLSEEKHSHIQSDGIYDPVGDMAAMTSPGLLHKYNGRALLITTGACAIHCRYCFRRHYPYQHSSCKSNDLDAALGYLGLHPEIDEIILSGGDPLVMVNDKLSSLIQQLESAPNLSTLRIHSRLPVVLPDRIDEGLLELLQTSRLQIVMVIHSNHANELQHNEQSKLHLLHAAGITVLNQSVLLKGINDDAETLITLSKRLLQCNTLPYYLHLLDPVDGAMHFDVSRQNAMHIMTKLQQQLPGYLVPKLVQEIAGKQAKTAIFDI